MESPTLKRFKTSVETAQTKLLFTCRVCGSEQKVGAYWRAWNPEMPPPLITALRALSPGILHKSIGSCWCVWACRVSTADPLELTVATLWLFSVWESDFHCLSLFIYFFQMSVSLSVLVKSQKGSILAFPTLSLRLHSLMETTTRLLKIQPILS